ncbi:hypothetical protein LJR034_009201 [Caballeronia sp. LjRoot34]|uniref:hypothetical protein n=1 Tax=Caballeronia sp. LjRoot34 TaxID=3342325 RepID=UPI003ECF4BF8
MTSGLAFAVALAVWAFVPSANGRAGNPHVSSGSPDGRATLLRLLVISFVTATAVAAFEVGLSLRGTQLLGMNTAEIGLMFTECSLVMLTVQALVFSPLVQPEATRWLLTPALAILAASLAVAPFTASGLAQAIAVALVAGALGSFPPSPLTGSRSAPANGKVPRLYWQTAAASLGQSVGSVSGGVLFSVAFIPNAFFTLTAMVVPVGLLAQAIFGSQGKPGNAPLAKSALSDAPEVKDRTSGAGTAPSLKCLRLRTVHRFPH